MTAPVLTLVGQYNAPSGAPSSGSFQFTLGTPLRSVAQGEEVSESTVTATLNALGQLKIALVMSDGTFTSFEDTVYHVVQNIDGVATTYDLDFQASQAGTTINLPQWLETNTEILGAVSQTPNYAAVLAADLALKADLVGGVVPRHELPNISGAMDYQVANQAAMLALTAPDADTQLRVLRTDTPNDLYVLNPGLNPATLSNWIVEPFDPSGAAAAAAAGVSKVGLTAAMPATGTGSGKLYYATDAMVSLGALYEDVVSGAAYSPVLAQGVGQLPGVLEQVSGNYLRPVSGYAYAQTSKAGSAFGNAIRCVDSPTRLPAPVLTLTGPWTVELFCAPERINATEVLVGIANTPTTSQTAGVWFTTNSNQIKVNWWTSAGIASSVIYNGTYGAALPASWVAASYDGTSIRTFLNGVLVSTVATTLTSPPSSLAYSIAGFPDNFYGAPYPYRGQLDELRISNICRYTATYALPTAPLTADSHTVTLLNGSTWQAAISTLDPNVLQQKPGGSSLVVGGQTFPDGAKISGSTAQYNVTIPAWGSYWQDIKLNADVTSFSPYLGGQSGLSGMGLKFTPNNDGMSAFQVWSIGGGGYGSSYPLTQIVSPSIEFSGGTYRPDMVLEWDPDGPMITQLSGPDNPSNPADNTGDSGAQTSIGPGALNSGRFASGKTHALRVNTSGSGGHDPYNGTYQWSLQNVWHEYIAGVLTQFVPNSGFRRDGVLDVTNVGYQDHFGNQAGAGYSPGSALLTVSVSGVQLGRIGDKISLYAPSYGNRAGIGASSGGPILYAPGTAGGGIAFAPDTATSATPRQSGSLAAPGAYIHPLSGAMELGPAAVTLTPAHMLDIYDSSDWTSIYIKKVASATQPYFSAVTSTGTSIFYINASGTVQGPSGSASTPAYSFTSTNSTGLYQGSTGGAALAGSGVKGVRTNSGKTYFGSAAEGSEIAAIFANGSAGFGSSVASGAWLTADAGTIDATGFAVFGYSGGVGDLAQCWNSRSGTQVGSVAHDGGLRVGPTLVTAGAGPRIELGNITTEPTATSIAGGSLYAVSGALYWRGGNGTTTKIAGA